jgi:hypothetical protein
MVARDQAKIGGYLDRIDVPLSPPPTFTLHMLGAMTATAERHYPVPALGPNAGDGLSGPRIGVTDMRRLDRRVVPADYTGKLADEFQMVQNIFSAFRAFADSVL